jgi:hypothetical protein
MVSSIKQSSNGSPMDTNFTKLASIDVGSKIEKKNGLSYLSWAWAVDQLMRADPNANWSYGDPMKWGDTVMVFCTVGAFGKYMTAQLPVMDHRNKPIPNPDAFQVNTAMQRCLVKAIALHGLGLYIYAGEDLPASDEEKPEPKKESKLGGSVASQVLATNPPISDDRKGEIERLAKNVKSDFEAYGAETAYERIELEALEDIEKIYLSTLLPANIRNPITAYSRSLKSAKATA